MNQVRRGAAGENACHVGAVAHGIVRICIGVGIVEAKGDLAAGKELLSGHTGKQLLCMEGRLLHDCSNGFCIQGSALRLQGEHDVVQIDAAVNDGHSHSLTGIPLQPGGASVHVHIGIFHGGRYRAVFHALGRYPLIQTQHCKLLGRSLEHRRHKGVFDALDLLEGLKIAIPHLACEAIEQQGVVMGHVKGPDLPLDGGQRPAMAGQQLLGGAKCIRVQTAQLDPGSLGNRGVIQHHHHFHQVIAGVGVHHTSVFFPIRLILPLCKGGIELFYGLGRAVGADSVAHTALPLDGFHRVRLKVKEVRKGNPLFSILCLRVHPDVGIAGKGKCVIVLGGEGLTLGNKGPVIAFSGTDGGIALIRLGLACLRGAWSSQCRRWHRHRKQQRSSENRRNELLDWAPQHILFLLICFLGLVAMRSGSIIQQYGLLSIQIYSDF